MTPASTLPTVRETSILARRLGSPIVALREVAEIVENWSGRQWLGMESRDTDGLLNQGLESCHAGSWCRSRSL